MSNSLLRRLGTGSRTSLALLTLGLLLLLFLLDVLFVDREISFSIVYLLPVALAAWFLGRTAGIGFSILGATAWLIADVTVATTYSHPIVELWNAFVRFGFFLIVTLILTAQRRADHALGQVGRREREASQRDPLTGLLNSYGFFALAEEALRRTRSPAQSVTAVFIDVDDMRGYNNYFGRSSGDAVLVDIGEKIQQLTRPEDLAARFGEDEFVILLFGIDADAARRFAAAIHAVFEELRIRFGRPVQASIGIVVATSPRANHLHALVYQAERLMYSVKDAGKDGVRLEIFGPRAENTPVVRPAPKSYRPASGVDTSSSVGTPT